MRPRRNGVCGIRATIGRCSYVGLNRVERLMRENGISARLKRRWRRNRGLEAHAARGAQRAQAELRGQGAQPRLGWAGRAWRQLSLHTPGFGTLRVRSMHVDKGCLNVEIIEEPSSRLRIVVNGVDGAVLPGAVV